MPEGHTIHRVALDQTNAIGKQKLAVTSPQGRFANDAAQIDGAVLRRIEAVGKHLFYEFDNDHVMHVHLGLYGKFRVHDNPPPEPRGAVRVRMIGKRKSVDLNGPNQCELIEQSDVDLIRKRLGPDPLDAKARATKFYERVRGRKTPIGALLMDQSVLSGIGNIYRTEILWLLKIHPLTPGEGVTDTQLKAIWKEARRLMAIGVKYDRIITTDLKKTKTPPQKLPGKRRFNIYKRDVCPTCETPIETLTIAGRKAFACPSCQPHITA